MRSSIVYLCVIFLSDVPSSGPATGVMFKTKKMRFHPYAKFVAAMFAVHLVQYLSEYFHYQHCSRGMFWSVFTRGSPMCTTLRATSDAFAGGIQKVLAGGALVAVNHSLNKLLEGGSGKPTELLTSE